MRRLFLLAVFAAVCGHSAVVAAESPAAAHGSARLDPVAFARAAGWHVHTGRVHACPGVSASRCSQVTSVASTAPWRDCVECLPHKTFAAMPASGVAIQITVAV